MGMIKRVYWFVLVIGACFGSILLMGMLIGCQHGGSSLFKVLLKVSGKKIILGFGFWSSC